MSPERARLEAREKALKERVRAIYRDQHLRQEKRSYYADVPATGKTVRVTEPEPTYTLSPDRLRALVGDAVFLRVVRVQKVELLVDEWVAAREAELVTDAMLEDASEENLPTPTVSVTNAKRTPVSDEPEGLLPSAAERYGVASPTLDDFAGHYAAHPEAQEIMLRDLGFNVATGLPPEPRDTLDADGLETL